jgi:hypothetical protein
LKQYRIRKRKIINIIEASKVIKKLKLKNRIKLFEKKIKENI